MFRIWILGLGIAMIAHTLEMQLADNYEQGIKVLLPMGTQALNFPSLYTECKRKDRGYVGNGCTADLMALLLSFEVCKSEHLSMISSSIVIVVSSLEISHCLPMRYIVQRCGLRTCASSLFLSLNSTASFDLLLFINIPHPCLWHM